MTAPLERTGSARRAVPALSAVLALLLLTAGVAILGKPPATPAPVGLPSPLAASRSAASQPSPTRSGSSSTTPSGPSPVASPSVRAPTPDTAFTTPAPPAANAAWRSLRWEKVEATDPLTLVRSVLRWRRGFFAVGWDGTHTPVWTSPDGVHWDPLPFNTAATFWPGSLIVGVAETTDGLVALTMLGVGNGCGGELQCETFQPGLHVWTSPDGRTWQPRSASDGNFTGLISRPPLLAAGRSGLVMVSVTPPARVAFSSDGIRWTYLPSGALPTDIEPVGLAWTSQGFALVGRQESSIDPGPAVAMFSSDGTAWSAPSRMDAGAAATLASTAPEWGVNTLLAAHGGLIARGGYYSTPGEAIWWHSADGRHWHDLPGWPPLGPTTCTGEGCGSQPNGTLLADGSRMVAFRGGTGAAAWTSSDGIAWRRLAVSGDAPRPEATGDGAPNPQVLLPDGVLVSDGRTTWLGVADA